MQYSVTFLFNARQLSILKQIIMTTLNLNTGTENKQRTIFVNFANTKRLQWSSYRRYGL